MSKPVANLVFQAVLIVVLAIALYLSLGWPRETALFPQAVGAPILALTIISLGLDARRMLRGDGVADERAEEMTSDFNSPTFLAKALAIFAWLLGFGVAIWLVGFYLAAFSYLTCYLKLQARLSLAVCLLSSVLAVAMVFLLFRVFLEVEPYSGLLGRLLGF